ncbi:YrbL family protein [Frateuria defendens]|uniref:YrbL family protein n=1 Tax=Frateuria defendens TaxID=2219559 RepID=UPI00066FD093|nr:YrbL family protein [Frateuria defendens]
MLALRHLAPIASGHLRRIFQHPAEPDLLVKVMREDAIAERWTNAPWYRRRSRTGPYAGFVREFKEYVASRHYALHRPSPLARVAGLADTDLGLGLVVEKVRGADGGLAPTLDAWVRRDGFTPAMQAALDDFLASMLEHNVIAGDLHAWNVVHGVDSRGGPRLVMIDGFGEKNIIPHCSMSRRHNAARTLHKFRRMVERTRATPRG